MERQYLRDGWILRDISSETEYPAKVPGSVYQTLLENGAMEDPFFRDNENRAMERMKTDYDFRCSFDAEASVCAMERKELVFEGVDTLADITLNGVLLGSAANMHRTWRFDVTGILKESANELQVCLHGPIPFIKEAYAKCRANGSEECMVGFPHLRKAHYMFGWDWGPHLPDAGLFRDVFVEGFSGARIQGVIVHQDHRQGEVELRLDVEEIRIGGSEPSYEVKLTDPAGREMDFSGLDGILVNNPMLWWPNGLGEQNLYTLEVIQRVDGQETDRYVTKIGLRTLTVHIEKDEWGESFAHRVNGVDIFAMGADYIPEDNLLGRTSREKTRELLQSCKDSHFNSIRVWGGGIYPSDDFFELCDEMGLLVWQDLMFACAVYELTEEFEENISREIEDNLRRIRNHACLALICGNNEMEMFVDRGVWVSSPKQKADYIKMYEYIFPKLVKRYAPESFYWPASPSSGGSFDNPNDFSRGDVHYWDVWHSNVPFSAFRSYYFRYLSEFGFQALPAMKTIRTFTDREEDLNLFSYVMEKHQRNNSANSKIMQYMQATFLYPTSFETLIYASQLLQAEAIKYGVEHFRRNRGRCMGAIYWQLNDCWPVISWSSIDYCGRWKALQYYAKRFFSPVLLSCEETNMMTENYNPNGENETFTPAVRFNVSNETMRERKVVVSWELRKNSGEVISSAKEPVTVPALSAVWLEKTELPEADWFEDYVSYRLADAASGEVVSESTVLFARPKYFRFADPKLQVSVSGDEIRVESQGYAKNVEILNENEDLILSDNYFDMNPGTRTVRILKGNADSLRVRSVYDIR